MPRRTVTRKSKSEPSVPQELAKRILASLRGGHFGAKFVDDYAQQFHRPEASAHPARRSELEAILEREMLLAMTARVALLLEEKKPRQRVPVRGRRTSEINPARFLHDFIGALARDSEWTAGDTMEFRSDLEIYCRLTRAIGGRSPINRARPSSSGPFVDRCAILLDPSIIENASHAAGKFLPRLEALADQLFDEISARRR